MYPILGTATTDRLLYLLSPLMPCCCCVCCLSPLPATARVRLPVTPYAQQASASCGGCITRCRYPYAWLTSSVLAYSGNTSYRRALLHTTVLVIRCCRLLSKMLLPSSLSIRCYEDVVQLMVPKEYLFPEATYLSSHESGYQQAADTKGESTYEIHGTYGLSISGPEHCSCQSYISS